MNSAPEIGSPTLAELRGGPPEKPNRRAAHRQHAVTNPPPRERSFAMLSIMAALAAAQGPIPRVAQCSSRRDIGTQPPQHVGGGTCRRERSAEELEARSIQRENEMLNRVAPRRDRRPTDIRAIRRMIRHGAAHSS